MVSRRNSIAFVMATLVLGCSQILELDKYSPRPAPSSADEVDGGPPASPDAGPLPACGATKEGSCDCPAGTCAASCPHGGCTFVCESGASCYHSCAGSGCSFLCKAGSTCFDSCAGGNCTFVCDPQATCANSCAGGNCK